MAMLSKLYSCVKSKPWWFLIAVLVFGSSLGVKCLKLLFNRRIEPKKDENTQNGGERRTETGEELSGEEYRVDRSDDLHCDYDSTWETEPGQQDTKSRRSPRSHKFRRFENASRDMQNYRHDYPNLSRTYYWSEEETDGTPNLDFYLGKSPCLPDNLYIHDIHKKWIGDYDKLERVHTYIQWLFPLQEPGVNSQAKTLTKKEIQNFCSSDEAKKNLLESYKIMLDFYGIKLCDDESGRVERADNWEDRFDNLNRRTHNNLRITRILKCLGTLGYKKYQAPLVEFFLEQTLVYKVLENVKESVLNYFVFALLDRMERRRLIRYAYKHYPKGEQFVWCPEKIQRAFDKQLQHRNQSCVIDI